MSERWLVARLGGDEFAAVRIGPVDESALVAEAGVLARAVAEPMRVAGYELRVGCSIGLTQARGLVSPSELLGRADAALAVSKRLGGRPVVWDPRRDDCTGEHEERRGAIRVCGLWPASVVGDSGSVTVDAERAGGSSAMGRVRAVARVAGAS